MSIVIFCVIGVTVNFDEDVVTIDELFDDVDSIFDTILALLKLNNLLPLRETDVGKCTGGLLTFALTLGVYKNMYEA